MSQDEYVPQMDVSRSNLVATAQEFYPMQGAVRKQNQQGNGRRNQRAGSGRTFSGRSGYGNRDRQDQRQYNRDYTDSRPYNRDTTDGNNRDYNRDPNESRHYQEPSTRQYPRDGDSRHFNNRESNDSRHFNRESNDQRHYNRDTNNERRQALQDAKRFLENYNPNTEQQQNQQQHSSSSSSNSFYYNNKSYQRNNYDNNDAGNRYEGRDNRYNGGRNYNNGYYDNSANRRYYNNKYTNNKQEQDGSAVDDYTNRDDGKKKGGYEKRFDKGRNNGNFNKQRKNDRYTKDVETRMNKKLDAASQRGRLEQMLNRKMLECLVCCENIRNNDKVWSCTQCYHILHLACITAWAKSSKAENSWRCPACQNKYDAVPSQYRCYCGKVSEPRPEPGVIPHGCGDTCLRKGRTCEHKCTILCHPGPCPECTAMVPKGCGCGKTQPVVKCSADVEIVCESTCDKLLECGLHDCTSKCHSGPCNPCDLYLHQECFCGKLGRKVRCTAEYAGCTVFACDDICDKLLSCGNHRCLNKCHEGPCDLCPSDLSVKTCPCTKTPLEERKSCLDPIPCCGKVCGKRLLCGQPSSPHTCKEKCHEGDCPPCPFTTMVRCRCGHMDKEMACRALTTKADDARCEKKCTKKRLCGKHRCNQRCCIEVEHICPLPCNHQLTCGLHRCERTCHSGRCLPCFETSFEELYCECGSSVIYPPVACGTKPPVCEKMCSRPSTCGHPMTHQCHTGPCPPCAVLVKRWCHGQHEQRATIPCHQLEFSCGLPCNKPMPCGRHKCTKPCHQGDCPLPCKQPCTVPRLVCGHGCNKPCHEAPCPESTCRQMVPVTCQCGLLTSQKTCNELVDEYRNLEIARIRDRMGDLAKDQTVDISDIVNTAAKVTVMKILDCNDECRLLERNRRMAIGLQIRNPDLSQKLTPRYSDFMKQWAKKDSTFCQRIHEKLTDLVQLAKQSKQKSRSYSFEIMNRDKRHFIHEYCEHFGVESVAYDSEPNRNIVATAIKDKSWLPSISLMEFIARENGHRKVPGPMLNKGSLVKPAETVSLKLPGRPGSSKLPAGTPVGETIDYFDNPPC